jgi:hypothetical protein
MRPTSRRGGVRRRAVALGGILLTASVSACGATSDGRTPPPATLSAEQAATKSSCEALGQAYNQKMAPFAEAVTGMVNGRPPNGKPAQQALHDLATAIRAATESSTDAQLRTDGKKTADLLTAKATDDAFFRRIRTPDDVRDMLGPTLKGWLAPVTTHCT